jgi:hemin uptake protein HemP
MIDTSRPGLPTDPERQAAPSAGSERVAGCIPAQCLFQGGREILIDHNNEIYRLRITKNDKLILTK